MLHVTFMGGAEVRVKEPDNLVITFCGGTEILMPTIAEKIIYLNRMKNRSDSDEKIRRTHVITMMGATVLKFPTLGREIKEMIELRESGMFTDEQLADLWREVLQMDDLDTFEFFTLMGGAGDEYPNKGEDVAALKKLLIMGIINQDELNQFEAMIRGKDYSFRELPALDKFREILLPPRSLEKPSANRILLANSRLTE
jgi:hypothetical protein